MHAPPENSGIINVRVGPALKDALDELASVLKEETGKPSVNAALVAIIMEWVTAHKGELSERARFNLLFDQQPRVGRK